MPAWLAYYLDFTLVNHWIVDNCCCMASEDLGVVEELYENVDLWSFIAPTYCLCIEKEICQHIFSCISQKEQSHSGFKWHCGDDFFFLNSIKQTKKKSDVRSWSNLSTGLVSSKSSPKCTKLDNVLPGYLKESIVHNYRHSPSFWNLYILQNDGSS